MVHFGRRGPQTHWRTPWNRNPPITSQPTHKTRLKLHSSKKSKKSPSRASRIHQLSNLQCKNSSSKYPLRRVFFCVPGTQYARRYSTPRRQIIERPGKWQSGATPCRKTNPNSPGAYREKSNCRTLRKTCGLTLIETLRVACSTTLIN